MNIALKQAREKACLTQVQVADRANIQERSYQYYEAGERTPNTVTAVLIANILHSTVEELFSSA